MTKKIGEQWLQEFAEHAAKTDRLSRKTDHVKLLAAGLIGETGSIIAEIKKTYRQGEVYYRERVIEEIGDFLWYFVRLAASVAPDLLDEIQENKESVSLKDAFLLEVHLDFGVSVGEILTVVRSSAYSDIRAKMCRTWILLNKISDVSLCEAAKHNMAKTKSLWPEERQYKPFFDDEFPVEEQLPRLLQVDFLECSHGTQNTVILRCNNINLGDRLTDNSEDPDGYRFHDVFHFAYAVYLGWSPVVRALTRTKRKSRSKIDEMQDGARARVIEEAVSAVIFRQAKKLQFFEGVEHVDLGLLKTVSELVEELDVADVPLWQWEEAILKGYLIFREVCSGSGGRVTMDLVKRTLTYAPLTEGNERAKQRPSSSSL